MLRSDKTLDLVHMRRANQTSVQTVRPSVIRALDRLAKLAALFLAQSRSTVAANIVKSVHFSHLITQNNQTFPCYLLHEIIARLWNLTHMTDAQPLREENTLQFFRKNVR